MRRRYQSSNTALAEAFGFAWYGGALEFGSNAGQGYGSAGYGSAGYASFNGDGNNYRFGRAKELPAQPLRA